MKLIVDTNVALGILIEMTVESVVTNRLLIDAICELTYPNDEASRLLLLLKYRQQSEAARITILHKIYEAKGEVDLDDIGLDPNEPEK